MPAFVADDDEVEVLIQGVDENELPSIINPDGRLVLTTGNFVRVQGRGFTTAGFAEVWLYSTPQLLGQVPKDSSGNFVGRVRVPAGIEAGEHTIELRAKTRRGRSILMSVPALVIGGSSQPDSDADTPGSGDVIGADSDAEIVATTIQDEVILIEIEPGATEVVIPVTVITEVVVRVLPTDVAPASTDVEVRTNLSEWEAVDLSNSEPVVLPLDEATDGVEVRATTRDGRVFSGSIPIEVRRNFDQLVLAIVLTILVLGIFIVWFISRKRRRDEQNRRGV